MGKSKLEKTEQFISVSQPTNQQKKKHKENELKSNQHGKNKTKKNKKQFQRSICRICHAVI
jgi:hypothetical protein